MHKGVAVSEVLRSRAGLAAADARRRRKSAMSRNVGELVAD